ncbi:MAG: hypothetical protein ABIP17_12845 [Ilumatobacteraceae bacterium]
MLTICWAAKGGSGTTVFATVKALTSPTDTLLIDLAGDVLPILGLPDPDGPGLHDWLRSESPVSRLSTLEQAASNRVWVLPPGRRDGTVPADRWDELATHLHQGPRTTIVDAGSVAPPSALFALADERLLVTRACYLSLRHAVADRLTPTGIILIEEPGRSLRPRDIEASIGAPIVTTVLLDPAIARAADAGLLASRLPLGWRRQMRHVA